MKLVATLTAVLILCLVAPSRGAAIDHGVPDGDRHPNVGLLAFDLDGPGGAPPAFLCSGSVISERVFLTAAHCIDVFPEAEWSVSLEPGSPSTPAVTPGLLFDDFPFAVRVPTTAAVRVAVHPSFDPETRAHDLAVLVMPKRTFAGVRPVRLAPKGLLRHLVRRQTSLTLVGYGADPDFSGASPRFVLEGYRQLAAAPVTGLTRHWVEIDNTTALGGVCLGDSGSPQFVPGTNIAVSQVSTDGPAEAPCTGTALAHRLDRPAERRFLARYLD
jgi:Trypsin